MSFEKIIHKLRDAWRQDIRQSLGGLPGYYWGEVTAAGEVLLDAVAPGAAPVPADDLVGAAIGDRVLMVHVYGAFSMVGVAGRPHVGDTGWQRITPASGYTNATDSTEAQYRHKDGVVYLRGTLTKDSGTIGAGETVGAVPEAYAPDRYTGFPLATLTPENGIRGRVNTAGQIGTQTGTTLGSTITLDGAFWLSK